MKIYESPDKGKTIYERNSGSIERTLIKSTVGEIKVPISFSELIDKITILQIKLIEIKDAEKLKNIQKEYDLLTSINSYISNKSKVSSFMNELFAVNYKLWNLEEDIRKCEREQSFEKFFIESARSIYKTNDERSRIKKEINLHFGSELVEEKSHEEIV